MGDVGRLDGCPEGELLGWQVGRLDEGTLVGGLKMLGALDGMLVGMDGLDVGWDVG